MNSTVKRVIVIVAFHFLPSSAVGAKRMTSLASYLASRGDRVVVVSAFEGIDSLDPKDSRRSTLSLFHLERVPVRPTRIISAIVRIKRVLKGALRRHLRSANPSPLQRTSTQPSALRAVHRSIFSVLHAVDDRKRWSFDAYRRVARLSGSLQPDLIIASGPPMSPLLGAVLAAKRRRIPVIVDLRDPIIGVDGATPAEGWLDKRCRQLLERVLVRDATCLTTTSVSLRNHLYTRYSIGKERAACIPNGIDGVPEPQRITTDGTLVIVYAGTLYMNRNPFPLLEVVDGLLSKPDVDPSKIRVIFAGDCDHYKGVSLRGWSASRPCGRILEIRSRLEADELNRLYDRGTLLINFAEGQRMQIPAKTFEVLARGREVLVICEPESDTAALVGGIPGLFICRSDDRETLEGVLLNMYERHVRRGVMSGTHPRDIAQFSRLARNQEIARLIDDAIVDPRFAAGRELAGGR